jgi:hypothetical protein
MTPRLTFLLAFALVSPALADEPPFTKGLSPADFAAAGLGKLTPEELSTLDALVHAREAGAVAVAKDETTKQVTQVVRQQVKAEDQQAAAKQASAGFMDRMKVLLKPGTEIEYSTLDSAIVPPFDGYDPGSVLTLVNGQRWKVVDDSSDYRRKVLTPVPVKIVPGSLGSFFMQITGSGRPKVKYVGSMLVIPAATPAAHP